MISYRNLKVFPEVLEQQRPRILSSLYRGLVILSSLLVGFTAFRNTLTW